MLTFAFEGYIANVYSFSESHFKKVNVYDNYGNIFCQSCVFKTWKLKHGKSYGAARHYGWHQANEEKFRKSIWINNKAKIENHNQQFYQVKQNIF